MTESHDKIANPMTMETEPRRSFDARLLDVAKADLQLICGNEQASDPFDNGFDNGFNNGFDNSFT